MSKSDRISSIITILFMAAVISVGLFLINYASVIFSSASDFPKFMTVVSVSLSIMFFGFNRIYSELPSSKENKIKNQLDKIEQEVEYLKESVLSLRSGFEELIQETKRTTSELQTREIQAIDSERVINRRLEDLEKSYR